MTPGEFILERGYLKNVTIRTIGWYEQSFKAFEGALSSKAAIVARVAELRQRGVAAISVNSYLGCINAYLNWLHLEHGQNALKIPRLREGHKILATLSPDHIKRLLQYKPRGESLRAASPRSGRCPGPYGSPISDAGPPQYRFERRPSVSAPSGGRTAGRRGADLIYRKRCDRKSRGV
jgi:hypothetical protein